MKCNASRLLIRYEKCTLVIWLELIHFSIRDYLKPFLNMDRHQSIDMSSIRLVFFLTCLIQVCLNRESQAATCGGVPINTQRAICCSGTINSKLRLAIPRCCGRNVYDGRTAICCNGVISSRLRIRLPRCCGINVYNSETAICINGRISPR